MKLHLSRINLCHRCLAVLDVDLVCEKENHTTPVIPVALLFVILEY
jgi:hypothetical protein